MQPLLKPPEVAEVLGVSLSTFYTYYREWGVPVIRVGKHLRCRPTDLEVWLERQRVT
jgi:excisionase family DNA binding protein